MPNPLLQSATRLPLVNGYLDAFMSRKIQAAREVNPRYEALWHEIARVAGAGKRLRPLMLLQAYEAFGGQEPSTVTPAAAACELLHVSMLIHDDIIDRDLIRHGQPTIQGAYLKRYAGEVRDTADRNHNAMGAAILAGDLLLSDARGLITKCEVTEELARHAGYAFDQAVFEVAGGELLDVESASAPRGSVDSLAIMTFKTASYSFVGPLLIGAILAGAPLNAQRTVRSFGLNLGVAYQLTDDILGIFGDSDETGKSNDGDIREGKATYLVERFYALASADQVEAFERHYGNRQTDAAGCETVRALLTATGALHQTETLVGQYVERARRDLAQLGLTDEHTAAFEALIAASTDRTA